ncbi:MAG: MBL fold metallo-hydrolase RNA specificity domain-containing protein [Pseudohongiellaceae bacterium]
MEIRHHGAIDGVTGSCHELRLGADYGVLVDCGLFQGAETSGEGAGAERLEIGFPIAHIKALVVTHVHIDHVGRIPYLLAAGFRGPILCSQPSAHLLPLVLEDAVKLGFSRDPELVEAFLDQLRQQLLGLPYDHWFTLLDAAGRQLRIRLQPAGHILGSAYVEFDCTGSSESAQRIVFSGDLGAPHSPLLPEPKPPERCDTLVIESTYGDRRHPDRTQRRAQLQAVLQRALQNRGVVLIPAFSIGRTQELLYELETLVAETPPGPDSKGAAVLRGLPVIVDSPLASRFTASYRTLKPFWDAEALEVLQQGRDPLDFDQLITVGSHQEHERMLRRLRETHEPCVVIAASGMCAGGRIVNYLKALLDDPRTDLVFVGYQARGTPGRAILDQRGQADASVLLDGERVAIRAAVHQLSGYSAHADCADLLAFVRGIPQPPREVRIIHGEDGAKQSLARALRAALPDTKVWIP